MSSFIGLVGSSNTKCLSFIARRLTASSSSSLLPSSSSSLSSSVSSSLRPLISYNYTTNNLQIISKRKYNNDTNTNTNTNTNTRKLDSTSSSSSSSSSSTTTTTSQAFEVFSLSSSKFQASCLDDDDCTIFETCVIPLYGEGQCVALLKTCPSDCNGHGKCVYINNDNNKEVDECILSDMTCSAQCICVSSSSSSSYTGSSCDITINELIIKQNMRETLVSLAMNMQDNDDVTEETVSSITSLVSSLSLVTNEINDHTRQMILTIAMKAIHSSSMLNIPYDRILSLTDIVNSYLESNINTNTNTNSHNTNTNSDNTNTNSNSIFIANVHNLVESFSQIMANDVVTGQDAIIISKSNYRLVLSSLSSPIGGIINDDVYTTNTIFKQRLPQTVIINPIYNNNNSSSNNNTNSNTNSDSMIITITTINSKFFGNGSNINVNPMSIRYHHHYHYHH
jgi:hypothetical protein